VVSVHGGDLLYTARHTEQGRRAVERTFAAARLVLTNSHGTEARCRDLGARDTRVVHLGTDLPPEPPPDREDALVSVGHLVPRKRQGDVIRALWLLRERWPNLGLGLIGDGPERGPLESLSRELGLVDRVTFVGALPHDEAVERARRCRLFVLPSVDEAFGVAYVEAMAGWVPAIGCRGEDGPQEIAAAGEGMVLVPPGDVEALAAELDAILSDDRHRRDLRAAARRTVEEHFTWEECGERTVAAYRDALVS
jgi:teichuronic acid biosynthesis glycosyltransferase TuaC